MEKKILEIEEYTNSQTKKRDKAESLKQVIELEIILEKNEREERRNNVIIRGLDLKNRGEKLKQNLGNFFKEKWE